jgi:PTH1 family peptidyl-tRNA hydrolase
MKIVVGLGNPGKRYEKTRHNVGFDVLEELARRHAADSPRVKFDGLITEIAIAGSQAILLWPQTFMNRSGSSVARLMNFYKTAIEDLLIICDDFNLPLGSLRCRPKGSSGGQRGLEDVIARLGGEDFARLRIGVGPVPAEWEPADFVLGRFDKAERPQIDESIALAAEGVECWATSGIDETMNRFNQSG